MKSKTQIRMFIFIGIVILISFGFGKIVLADDYYKKGTLLSTNLMDGLENVAIIESFDCTASVSASTTVYAKFSQDGTNWYDHNGYKGWWDSCSDGATNIDLTALEWTSPNFYYKLKFETEISTSTATVSQVKVNYSDTYTPPTLTDYHKQGSLVSANLLEGSGVNLSGTEKFGYYISSLPAGTTVQAQFSQDAVNWYSSTSTQWAWDTLSLGNHLGVSEAIDLSALGWRGDDFYYKLKFETTDESKTPIVNGIKLLKISTVVNAPLTQFKTGGLVGHWTFNGADMDWASSTAEALDRSGHSNNGDIVGAKPVIGISQQGLEFDGTDDYVDIGNAGTNIKTIAFWLKADDIISRKIINIDGTDQIEIDANSNIVATDFPAATIYVDALASSVISREWNFITIIDTTGVNASAMDIGKVSTEYFDGILDELRLYNWVLNTDEIENLYRAGTRRMKIIPTKEDKTKIIK